MRIDEVYEIVRVRRTALVLLSDVHTVDGIRARAFAAEVSVVTRIGQTLSERIEILPRDRVGRFALVEFDVLPRRRIILNARPRINQRGSRNVFAAVDRIDNQKVGVRIRALYAYRANRFVADVSLCERINDLVIPGGKRRIRSVRHQILCAVPLYYRVFEARARRIHDVRNFVARADRHKSVRDRNVYIAAARILVYLIRLSGKARQNGYFAGNLYFSAVLFNDGAYVSFARAKSGYETVFYFGCHIRVRRPCNRAFIRRAVLGQNELFAVARFFQCDFGFA